MIVFTLFLNAFVSPQRPCSSLKRCSRGPVFPSRLVLVGEPNFLTMSAATSGDVVERCRSLSLYAQTCMQQRRPHASCVLAPQDHMVKSGRFASKPSLQAQGPGLASVAAETQWLQRASRWISREGLGVRRQGFHRLPEGLQSGPPEGFPSSSPEQRGFQRPSRVPPEGFQRGF